MTMTAQVVNLSCQRYVVCMASPGRNEPPAARPQPRPEPDDTAAEETQKIVERAQAGDHAAFGLLYNKYFAAIFRFIYARVGNKQLAEDLTADTFLRALKHIGSFTWQGRDPGAWLVTIARNRVADHFKSGRHRLEFVTDDLPEPNRVDNHSPSDTEVATLDYLTSVELMQALTQLPPDQRECIVLRFLLGKSLQETAQLMGKRVGAIKALQYRAVRALGRQLPVGFEP